MEHQMPQYNHLDRCMVELEMCLWNANEVLSQVEHAGAFACKLSKVRLDIEAIATEVRAYNDQFEVND